jgi:hypothetical protein
LVLLIADAFSASLPGIAPDGNFGSGLGAIPPQTYHVWAGRQVATRDKAMNPFLTYHGWADRQEGIDHDPAG